MSARAERLAASVSDPVLWFGVLAAPIAWAVHLMVVYPLVYIACAQGSNVILHLVTIATLVPAVLGTAVAWRSWQRLGNGPMESTIDAPRDRSRFMALGGALLGAYSIAAICAAWATTFVLDPCAAAL